MRAVLGASVLLAGIVLPGWWATTHQAKMMETVISGDATALTANTVHRVTTRVSGRDIELHGLVDTAAEGEALVAALNKIPGRRVVRADLTVLAPADPYTTRLDKAADGTLQASGVLPSEAARRDLAALTGTPVAQPVLASGAPQNHMDLVANGASALALMHSGSAGVTGGVLTIRGIVDDVAARDAVEALVAARPAGEASARLVLPAPPAWSFDFSAPEGGTLRGVLPPGIYPQNIARALGLGSLKSEAAVAADAPLADLPGVFAALARWLPDLESLSIILEPPAREQHQASSRVSIGAGVGKGADLELITAGLAADLGPDVDLSVTEIIPDQPEGSERIHALTGVTERLTSGYWLPVSRFTIDKTSCQQAADAILGNATVNFVTDSARLDASARGALNRLAAIIAPCAGSGLRAEIGGHTDSTGDAAANITLSQQRADAVRLALIARGVPAGLLLASGYGDTMPVADNATEQGRAQNRRTTVVWSE